MAAVVENDLLSAQELAKLAHEQYHTIDYWSERGILVFKRLGRKRFYGRESNLLRIRFTRERQNRGHSIEGILDEIHRQGF
jgi:DNA-binding transcriptional MerR regulator